MVGNKWGIPKSRFQIQRFNIPKGKKSQSAPTSYVRYALTSQAPSELKQHSALLVKITPKPCVIATYCYSIVAGN